MADIKLTSEEIETMLDNAARRGAKEALRSIGLLDNDAQKDILEMRNLIEAWRDTRRSIWSTVVKLATVGTLTFIAGAKKISLSDARSTVDAKSSEDPALNLEIVFAVAGATRIMSAHLDSDI